MTSPKALVWSLAVIAAAAGCAIGPASGAETLKIGFSAPITGPFAENGRQMVAALKLYAEEHGTEVAGRKIEVILRDDGGVADQAKRIAQELVVTGKVGILAGYNPTPAALAVAPLATEAKIPEIVVGSSASITTERSPYIVRTFGTQAQITVPMAQWALKNGIKQVVTLVADYSPGVETEKAFVDAFKAGGGEIIELVRVPLRNPDFSPFLQRARDARPQALFVWVPGGLAGPFPPAICRARPAGVGHPAHRSRRYHRRRRAQSNGRRDARHHDVSAIFRRASVGERIRHSLRHSNVSAMGFGRIMSASPFTTACTSSTRR